MKNRKIRKRRLEEIYPHRHKSLKYPFSFSPPMKRWIIALTALVTIPFVLADISSTLSNVWYTIIGSIGNLSFLGVDGGSMVVAFTRILVWLLVFTLIFGVITLSKTKSGPVIPFLTRRHAAIVALIIATISAIFMPASILLATGTSFATIISFLLIGGPVAGFFYLMWAIPFKGAPTRGTYFLKLVLCFLLFWILSVMRYYVGGMG